MRKYNVARLSFDSRHDEYVKHSVMVFGDQANAWNGRVLERCAAHFDAIVINLGADEEIKRHRHEGSEELILVLSGSGRVWQGEQTENLEVSDLVYLEKGVAHTFKAGEMGLKFLQIHSPPMHDRVQE